jgi:hypothetical protein
MSVQNILKAASNTAQYVDEMRLPKRNEAVTKYAVIKGNKVKDSGFVMLSPRQAKMDQTMGKLIAYGFAPVVLTTGLINGVTAQTRAEQILGFTTSVVSLVSIGYYIHRNQQFSKAKTLVFPKV